ncbi:universal stress protein [Algoriphagus sp. AK58]|uniref:universal stress protein n=1 Tax=Algoriphagus sp. AK58 TaxID=1406877 RepID=UPI0016502010|nr:universal stress protein [Algoriphagus sp. AK58]
MKTIVVPFDFSEYSLAALQTAQRISVKSGAKIICVTVVPSEVDWDLLPEEAKKKYPDLIEEMEEAKSVIPDYLKRVAPAKAPIEIVVKIGVPYEQILRVLEKSQADLAVLGAYGKGFIEGKFIGSNLQKVIRLSHCPVLAVKKVLDGNAFRKIAFASIFNESSKKAFSKMVPIAKLFKASVHLVYINTPEGFVSSTESEQAMSGFSKGHEELVLHTHVFNHKDIEQGIIEFCKSKSIELAAVVSGDRKGMPAYLVGTTDTLIFKSEMGVLSIKND